MFLVLFFLNLLIWKQRGVSLWEDLRNFSRPLESVCQSQFQSATLKNLGNALVCAQDLSPGASKDLFLQLGLYHVIVVSGAHLIFLSFLLTALSAPRAFKFLLLFLFAVMTGLQAPVLRAGLQMLIPVVLPRQHRQSLLISYLLCLALHPPWLHSVSLNLSMIAALGMQAELRPHRRALWILAFTLPLLLPYDHVNPLGSLFGLLLSPVCEALLFPICLLAWLFPWLQALSETILAASLTVLQAFAEILPPPLDGPQLIPRTWIWVYVFVIFQISPRAAAVSTSVSGAANPSTEPSCKPPTKVDKQLEV